MVFKGIKIEGTYFSKEDVAHWSRAQSTGIRKNVGIFLRELFGDSPYVYAKTSGSTGNPKEIALTKEEILRSAERTIQALGLTEGMRALLCLSPEFIAGKMMIVRAVVGKLDLWVTEVSSQPELPVPDIDFAAITPIQLHTILSSQGQIKAWQRVSRIIVGGGQLNGGLESKLTDWPNRIYETFGMTETVSHIALRLVNGPGASEYFTVLPGIEIELDDRGCLKILRPNSGQCPIMTNDLVQLLGKNMFRFIGRYDHVINSGGIKLHPEQIEKQLSEFISENYIIGWVPDSRLGQKAVLVIESRNWASENVKVLETRMRDKLGKYQVPRDVFFLPEFPRTKSGKIDRKSLISVLHGQGKQI